MTQRRILTVYLREWCHLCHDLIAQLKPLQDEFGFDLDLVDVETDPVLDDHYGERIPVLCDGELELCHYFLDQDAVRAHLLGFR